MSQESQQRHDRKGRSGGSAFDASWQRLGEEWLLRLTPISPGGKLPGRGETLTVDVTRKDGTEQRIPVRVEDWLDNAAGKPYAALARPERQPRKGNNRGGGKRRQAPAPAMPPKRAWGNRRSR